MATNNDTIVAYDGIFLNSKSIFVEYMDLVRPLYMIALKAFAAGPEIRDYGMFLLNLKEVHGMNDEDLTNWYIDRSRRNLLANFMTEEAIATIGVRQLDLMLDKNIESVPELIDGATMLNMGQVLLNLFANDNLLVKKGYIWYPYKNEAVLKDMKMVFSNILQYVEILMCPIEEALQKVPEDSTYCFSDITKIGLLEDMEKLDYSSIIVPVEYGYNAQDGHFIMDISEMQKRHPFKFNTYYATEISSL
jgi:hypothetical protein